MNHEKHQAALDGIRGFAALSVVLYHIGHWLDAPLASNSFLAVDLFFLLSGYVVSLAYDARIKSGLTIIDFSMLRIIRLMPLVILGAIISSIYIILRVHVKNENLPMPDLATAFLFGVFNIPYLTPPLIIGGNQVFPINGPQFSLFFELFINVVWAAFSLLRKKWVATIFATLCFIFIVTTKSFGGDTPESFIYGFPRVGFSFLLGVAIFHFNLTLSPWRWWPIVFWVCCGLMVVTFYAQELPVAYQIAWTVTISPILVLSGAHTNLRGQARSVSLFFGQLSYPIYILHYPIFVWINGIYQTATKQKSIILEGPIVLASVVLLSFLFLKFFDIPVRNKLNKILKRSSLFRQGS